MRERGDEKQRAERETEIEKQNGRESLGFFHLKLKFKRYILHLFFFKLEF